MVMIGENLNKAINVHSKINMKFKSIKVQIGFFLSAIPFIANAADKPNVIFIAIDDLNDWVGCLNGHPQAYTPNIDRLASQGVLFSNAHCQAPISGPSRASVMTGLYPSNSGNYFQVNDKDIKKSNRLTSKAVYLNQLFKANGYRTLGAGKIFHEGDSAATFDEYAGMFAGYGPFPKKRFNFDPSWYPDRRGGTMTDWAAFPIHDSLTSDYQIAEWAESKLTHSFDQPFFMAVGFFRPHVPWYVSAKWFDLFPEETIITPPYKKDDFADIPEIASKITGVPMMPTTEWLIENNQWKKVVQAYLASIAFVDAQVGRVLDALEKSNYAKNTIVVLWSDHGYHLGEKNRLAKQSLWKRDTHVPIIFKTSVDLAGKVVGESVQLVDIYPTLADLCGIKYSKKIDGRSLVSLMKGNEKCWPYPALSFFGKGNVSVSNSKYRLIQYEDGSCELYDIETDPNEWNNIYSDVTHKKVIKKLRKSIPKSWSIPSKHTFFYFHEYFNLK